MDVLRKWVGEPDSEIPTGSVLLHLQLGALFLAPGRQIGRGDCHGDHADLDAHHGHGDCHGYCRCHHRHHVD